MRTSTEGLWAAVRDVRAQLTRKIATAVSDGTAAAASAYVERWRDGRRRSAAEPMAETSFAA